MRQVSAAVERAPTLAEIKAKTLKPADAWWVVLVIDPIAVRILWLLVRVGPRVTPNAVTSGSLVLGLLSAAAFWQGRYGWGALLFQLSFLLDCIDGKLGRLTGQSSPWGAFYDAFVNNVVFGANVLGLMVSAPGDTRLAAASALLLLAWALHIHASEALRDARRGPMHTHHRPAEGGWLERHRLLPPMTFPDKHALLFVVGPITGYVFHVVAAIAILDLMTLVPKVRTVFRRTARSPGSDAS
jgi:phosphatidylglycerophosphate synthase